MNSSHLVPCTNTSAENTIEHSAEPDWHDDLVLIAELAALNSRIARFVTQMLDADAQRRPAVGVAEQAALGWELIELGQSLRDRAEAAASKPMPWTGTCPPSATPIFPNAARPLGERFVTGREGR